MIVENFCPDMRIKSIVSLKLQFFAFRTAFLYTLVTKIQPWYWLLHITFLFGIFNSPMVAWKWRASQIRVTSTTLYIKFLEDLLLIYMTHTYRMWGLHVKSKMAEQESKRLMDCITKMRFLAVLAFVLFRNSSDRILWERETYREDFEHIFERIG